jgi:hypothetical protein
MDFFENKNKEFYKFLDDTFNLKKCKTWDDVSQQISFDKIKATYKFFGNLFPRNFEYIKEFGVSNSSEHYTSAILEEIALLMIL